MLPGKNILFSSLFLLVIFSIAYATRERLVNNDESPTPKISKSLVQRQNPPRPPVQVLTFEGETTEMPTTTAMPKTTNRPTVTYEYPYTPYTPKDYKGKYGRKDSYDDDNDYEGRDRYDNDDDYGRQDGYRGKYRKVIGEDGIDPSEYGQDMADYGPIYTDKDEMYASLNVWIRAADDWENHDRPRYRNKYRGNKYNKNKGKNYKDDYGKDDDDYKKGDRKKRSYSRVQFPVRHFKDIRKFPHQRFPPLVSIFPWLPIFYDKLTYQTFIFSPTGGIYILPPLINFYGQRFAVAQLIKWGYASLVSSGAPPPPNVNVAPLVQPAPAAGPVPSGVAGGSSPAPGPRYDSKKNQFNDGVRTEFPDFKPRYTQTLEEGGSGYGNNRGGVNRNAYGADSNYGGTGRQEVYPQGGPRTGGAYN